MFLWLQKWYSHTHSMETVETKKVEAGSAGVPVCAQVDSAHLCWRDTARQHHASTEQRPPRSDFFVCHKQDSRGPAIARAAAELRGRSPSKWFFKNKFCSFETTPTRLYLGGQWSPHLKYSPAIAWKPLHWHRAPHMQGGDNVKVHCWHQLMVGQCDRGPGVSVAARVTPALVPSWARGTHSRDLSSSSYGATLLAGAGWGRPP